MPDFLKEDAGEDTNFALQLFHQQTGGSPEEFAVFSELEDRGLTAGVDFQFQSDRFGGLSHLGNSKIHFLIAFLKIGLRVQPIEWIGESKKKKQNDYLQLLIWQARGYFLADLLAQEIDQAVKRVVDLALDYQDTPLAASGL